MQSQQDGMLAAVSHGLRNNKITKRMTHTQYTHIHIHTHVIHTHINTRVHKHTQDSEERTFHTHMTWHHGHNRYYPALAALGRSYCLSLVPVQSLPWG